MKGGEGWGDRGRMGGSDGNGEMGKWANGKIGK